MSDSDDLLRRYREVRAASERLCRPLTPEDCALQSMPDASPPKWHLAHTSWFFEVFVLETELSGYRAFDPHYRMLFNSYYEAVGERHPRPQRGLLSRPSLDEVLAFRAHVDRCLGRLLEKPEALDAATRRVIELGIHHEQQHQELLLTDLKHGFFQNPLHPPYHDDLAPGADASAAPEAGWHGYEGGLHWIGHDGDGFAFDNESPRHRVFLEPFEIASRPVTNGEYLAFMRDGGYERPELWLADGWAELQQGGERAPLYWHQDEGEWKTFTLAGDRAVRSEEPVCHVSYYEADAFASWSGARLPSESEWEVAAGDAEIAGNFVESDRLHPAPAPVAAESDAPAQLFGDVWEWTRSAYAPYPGYQAESGALGEYNGKFMSNQMTLRGGSCATPGSHVRPSYRNFFFPPSRWQFSGIRLARDAR